MCTLRVCHPNDLPWHHMDAIIVVTSELEWWNGLLDSKFEHKNIT